MKLKDTAFEHEAVLSRGGPLRGHQLRIRELLYRATTVADEPTSTVGVDGGDRLPIVMHGGRDTPLRHQLHRSPNGGGRDADAKRVHVRAQFVGSLVPT